MSRFTRAKLQSRLITIEIALFNVKPSKVEVPRRLTRKPHSMRMPFIIVLGMAAPRSAAPSRSGVRARRVAVRGPGLHGAAGAARSSRRLPLERRRECAREPDHALRLAPSLRGPSRAGAGRGRGAGPHYLADRCAAGT